MANFTNPAHAIDASTNTSTPIWTDPVPRWAHPTRPGIYHWARPGLDMLVEQGPRDGVRRWWRQASKRHCQVALWHPTQRSAWGRGQTKPYRD